MLRFRPLKRTRRLCQTLIRAQAKKTYHRLGVAVEQATLYPIALHMQQEQTRTWAQSRGASKQTRARGHIDLQLCLPPE